MKKRILSVLCALCLLLGVLLPVQRARAVGTVYLLAVNDKICDLPGGLLPVTVNGVVYIPYTAFDKATTGVDLGVYYGLDLSKGTVLTLYALSGSLTFSVDGGQCVDGQGNEMKFRAVIRNRAVYIPASAVCDYFGLTYSFLPTTDRGTLIRISSSSASLSDSAFLNAMALAMTSRYNAIVNKGQTQATPTPSAAPTQAPGPVSTPTPASTATPDPAVVTREDVELYLALDASQAGEDILDLLPQSESSLLLLFTPDSLATQARFIRKAVSAGHTIGLTVEEIDPERALAELDRANDLLKHIARTNTRVAAVPAESADALRSEGWLVWEPTVTGDTAAALLRSLEGASSPARLTLPANAFTVSRVLTQVREDRYDWRSTLETRL